MKKFLVLFCLFIIIPFKVNAASITSVSLNSVNEVTRGENFDIDITVNLSGISLDEKFLYGVAIELKFDSKMLVFEGAQAENFTISHIPVDGVNVLVASLTSLENINSGNCTNGVFCNTFKLKINAYAKNSGTTYYEVGEAAAYVIDKQYINDLENLNEDKTEEINFIANKSSQINIINSSLVVTTTPPTKATRPPIQTTSSKPVTTTTETKTTTTTQATITTTAAKENSTNEKSDEEAIKEDQNKRRKINKKIITYVIIGLVIIILLVIANAIINKIRYRKIDKMLKKF